MEESIIQALLDCLSSDCAIRNKAEKFLSSARTSPGFIQILMKICGDNFESEISLIMPHYEQSQLEIKQLSALYLKTLIKDFKKIILSDEDVNYLKANIAQYLKLSIDEKFREIFEEIALIISKMHFLCEEIVNQIDKALESEDNDIIFSGINMIYQIIKTEGWKTQGKLQLYLIFIAQHLPVLNEILSCLLYNGSDNFLHNSLISSRRANLLIPSIHFSWKCIELILKTYQKCFAYDFWKNPYTINMERWWPKFQKILEFKLKNLQAAEYQNIDIWESKILVANILKETLNIFWDKHPYLENVKIARKNFKSKWAEHFLKTIVSLIFERADQFLPDSVIAAYIEYITNSIRHKSGLKFLESKIINSNQTVIFSFINEVILPLFYLNKEDEEMWKDSPIQFIQENQIKNQRSLLKQSAIIFLAEFTNYWDLKQFSNYYFKEIETANLIKKEALMTVFGYVCSSADSNNVVTRDSMQAILSSIYSYFDSHRMLLRWKICWLYGLLLDTGNLRFMINQRKIVFSKLFALLEDSEMPVKYQAAIAIPYILNRNALKKININYLLNIYISLIKETHLQELVKSLQKIVRICRADIIPYGLEFVQTLIHISIETFHIEDSNINLFRSGIFRIINRIIYAFRKNIENLTEISLFMVPIFDFQFSDKWINNSKKALHTLKILFKYSPPEALKHLCKYAEPLINFCLNYGEFPWCIYNIFRLYIEKYSESIGVEIYLNFIRISAEKGEYYYYIGRRLLIELLECRKGLIDSFLPEIIQITKLGRGKEIDYDCICAALWNNPIVTLKELVQQNILSTFIDLVCSNNNRVTCKRPICGICSLFLAIDEIPLNFSKLFLQSLFKLVLSLWKYINYWESSSESENEQKPESDEENYENSLNYPFCSMVFRKIDHKKFVITSIANFQNKNPNLYREIKRSLNKEEMLILKSIIKD